MQKQVFSHTTSQHLEPIDFASYAQSEFVGVFPYTSTSNQPTQLGGWPVQTAPPAGIRNSAERYRKAGQSSVNVSSMPAWVLFGGRITPGQQIGDAQRFAAAGNHGPPQLTLNPADPVFVRDNGRLRSSSTGSSRLR